jgi:RNA polymerase sigma factor (sigma-70 family)
MDIAAFKSKVLPMKQKLYRFSLRFVENKADAEDVVQEVFIRIWNMRDQMQAIQNWEAWCMRITRNLSLDKIRIVQRRQTYPLETSLHVSLQDAQPDERVEQLESAQRISKLIASLPEKQRQIIHLRDVEGYSYNEISEILEIDLNQVKVNLFRARNAVREKLINVNAYGL